MIVILAAMTISSFKMTAVDFIRQMRNSGLTISVVDNKLRVYPREAVTEAMKRQIEQNKPALLEAVLNENPARCSVCHGDRFWQGNPIHYTDGSTAPAPWVCRTCHPPPHESMVRRVLP